MSADDSDIIAFERECWKARDWAPAIISILSRLLFLPLLRLRDAARSRHILVKVLVGIVFYPLYVGFMVLFAGVSLLLLAMYPILFFVGRR